MEDLIVLVLLLEHGFLICDHVVHLINHLQLLCDLAILHLGLLLLFLDLLLSPSSLCCHLEEIVGVTFHCYRK